MSSSSANSGAMTTTASTNVASAGSPTSSRTPFCQTPPAIRISTNAIGPATASARHATALAPAVGSGAPSRRTPQLTSVPMPYPMTAPMPAISPWNSGGRGSSDGVIAARKPTTAPTRPRYAKRRA